MSWQHKRACRTTAAVNVTGLHITQGARHDVGMHPSCVDSDSDESVEERFQFKVVLIGPSDCGKTTLAQQLCTQTPSSKYTPTQGVDFFSTQVTSNSVRILLQVWDVGGCLRSPELAASYLHACDAVLVVYKGADQQSQALAEEWVPALQQLFAGHTLPYLALVANKHAAGPPLEDEQEAAAGGYTGEQLTAAPLVHRFQVSAMQPQDVRQLFLKVSEALCGLPLQPSAGASRQTAEGTAACAYTCSTGGHTTGGAAASTVRHDTMETSTGCWAWVLMCLRGGASKGQHRG